MIKAVLKLRNMSFCHHLLHFRPADYFVGEKLQRRKAQMTLKNFLILYDLKLLYSLSTMIPVKELSHIVTIMIASPHCKISCPCRIPNQCPKKSNHQSKEKHPYVHVGTLVSMHI